MARGKKDKIEMKMHQLEMKAHEAKGRAEQKFKDIRQSHNR